MMAKDFTHGWNSSNYIFRVEVDGRVEHEYTFSIDGVPFLQMQRKHDLKSNSNTKSKNSNSNHRESDNDNHYENNNNNTSRNSNSNSKAAPFSKGNPNTNDSRRSSNDSNDNRDNRGSFQSPEVINKGNSFDPFAPDTIDPFQKPFGADGTISSGTGPSSGIKKPPIKTPVKVHAPVPEVSLLDQEEISSKSATTTAFDPFGSNANNNSNDPFSTNKPSNRSAHDISQDFAGLSFAPPTTLDNDNNITSGEKFFDEEPLPVAPVPKLPDKEVWTPPKGLVNLDFTPPVVGSTTNAFSGRSPSLNLLLNGSSTRPPTTTGEHVLCICVLYICIMYLCV